MEEIVTKDRISGKITIICANVRKAVDSDEKSDGGHVVFIFYCLCQSLWGSSPAVNIILNSINLQDDASEALESAAPYFSCVIGLLDHHKESQGNKKYLEKLWFSCEMAHYRKR